MIFEIVGGQVISYDVKMENTLFQIGDKKKSKNRNPRK